MTAKPQSHTPNIWFPRHPLGGNMIYPDSETNEPLATFKDGDDCARAIECYNALIGIPDPIATLASVRAALEFYASVSDYVAPFTAVGKLYFDCGETARAALESLTQATDPSKL